VAASSHSCATWRQRLLEQLQVLLGDGAARGHRVAAEPQQHRRVALGHQVQRVAQVEAGDGAARALQLVLLARRLARREHEAGAVQLLLDARGHDAHHAFVELGVEQGHGGRRVLPLLEQRLGQQQRLLTHVALDLAALAVDAVQRARQFPGARRVVGEQAFDAQRHVRQPARRVDAGPEREGEVEGGGERRRAARHREQAGQAGRAARPRGCAARPWATSRRLFASSFTTSAPCPAPPAAAGRRAWAASAA
jgi:hypothetical protein